MWKNIVQPGGPQTAIRRMRISCWTPKTTHTHSEYVILLDFPLLQWLYESALMFVYTYFASLILIKLGGDIWF